MREDARLSPAKQHETVIVVGGAEAIDLATNTLGKTVTEREIVNLPLNGRNFAQLGLLQTGVAPLNAGLLVSHEGHKAHGAVIAERGYVRA